MFKKYEHNLDYQIENMKRIAKELEIMRKELHQDNNKFDIYPDKWYVICNGKVYKNEDDAKEDNIDQYCGLDDGMTDWYPEYDDIIGKDLIEMLREEEMELVW